MRTLVRYSALIIVFSSLVAVVAAVVQARLARTGNDTHTAQARVGLTAQVVWPFYDAARDRQVTALAADGVRQKIAAEISRPADVIDIRVDEPVNQVFVDVVVTARSAIAAREGANRAADYLVQTDLHRLTDAAQAKLDTARKTAADLDAKIAGYDAQLANVVADEASLTARLRPAPDADVAALQRGLLQDQLLRSSLETYRNEAIRSRAAAGNDVSEAEKARAAIVPEVEILRYASAPAAAGGAGSTVPRWALVAAVALAIGSIGALIWDREYGKLRSLTQLRGATAISTLGEVALPKGSQAAAGRGAALCALNLHDRAAQVEARVVGMVDLPGAPCGPILRGIGDQLLLAGYSVVTVGPPGSGGEVPELRIEQVFDELPTEGVDGQPASPSALGPRLRVAWAQTSSISEVAFAREALDALAASYDVVLVDCSQQGLRTEAWWSRVLSCDAVATIAAVRRTRISALRRLVRDVEGDTPHLGVIMVRNARSLAGSSARVTARPVTLAHGPEPVPAAG